MEKILTVDDVIKEDKDPDTGVSNYTYTNGELDNRVVITNDSGVVDYSLIEMTVEGGEGNENLLVATDEVGQIDNSFLKSTNTKKANSVVITNSVGVIDYNLLKASTSPTSYSLPATNRTNITYNSSTNKGGFIPVTNADNKLDNGWLNTATTVKASNKLVVTDGTGTINNNLINWTTGYSTNITDDKGNKDKLVKTSITTGKIDDSLLKTTITSEPNTIVKLDENGLLDKSIFRDDQFIPLTGGEPSGSIIIQGPQKANEADSETISLETLNEVMPEFYGFGANTHGDGFLIGMNGSSDKYNDLIIATHDDYAAIKMRQYGGENGYSGMTGGNAPASKEITLMDYSTGNTKLIKLTVDNDIVSSKGILQINGKGESSIAGKLTVSGGVVIPISGDKVSDTGTYGTAALTIGKNNSLRIEIDENEILAKNASNKPSGVGDSGDALHLQAEGGLVKIGQNFKANLHVNGNIRTTNYNSDPGNNEASEGNLTIVGKSSLIKDVTIGNSSNKTSSLSVQGNITSENGLFISKAKTGTNSLSSNLSVDGNITVGSTGTTGKTGNVNIVNGKLQITTNSDAANALTTHIQGNMASNDYWRISAGNSGSNDAGYLEISTWDNGTEPIYFKQYKVSDGTSTKLTLLDSSGNTILPGNLTLDSATGTITAYRAIFKSDLDAKASSNKEVALTVGGDGTAQHLEIDNNEIQSKATSTTTGNLSLNPDGGNVYIADNKGAAGSLYIPNGGIEIGGSLSVGKSISAQSLSTTSTLTSGGVFTANSTSQFNDNVTVGSTQTAKNLTVNGKITGTTLSVSGNSTLSNGITKDSNNNITARNYVTSGPIYIADGADLAATSYNVNNRPHLTIGNYTGTHIEIDNNEISAKAKNSTTSVVEPYILYIQPDGGKVQIGSTTASANAKLVIPSSTDKITKTSSTNASLIIGSETGTHLAFDLDEISARSNGTGGTSTLYLQPDSGDVVIGSNVTDGTSTLYVKGGSVKIGPKGTLKMVDSTNTRSHDVISMGSINGYGDNLYITGGGNITAMFSGESYTSWNNYVTGSNVDTNIWDTPLTTATDRIYVMSDDNIYLETNIQNGYANRKSFKFGTDGSLTVPNRLVINAPSGDKISATGDTSAPLIVGNVTGKHLALDEDEVSARTNSSGGKNTLYLQPDGGNVSIGGENLKDYTVNTTHVRGILNTYGKTIAQNGIDVTNGFIDINPNYTHTVTNEITCHIMGHMAGSDDWRIAGGATASDAGFVEIAVADNGNENIYVRKYKRNASTNEHFETVYQEIKLLDTNGNTEFPGKVTATGGISIPINGDKVFIENANSVPLMIGKSTGVHLEVDNNEILAKSNESTMSDLNLQTDGGELLVFNRTPGAMTVNGKFYIKADGQTSNTYDNPNEPIRIKYKNKYGNYTFYGGRGPTVVGGGEGAYELYDYWFNTNSRDSGADPNRYNNKATPNFEGRHTPKNDGSIEDDVLVLTSDENVYIHTNVQANYENRKEWEFRNTGELICPGKVTAPNLGTPVYKQPTTMKLLSGSDTDISKRILNGNINLSESYNNFDALLIAAEAGNRDFLSTTILPVWELNLRKKLCTDLNIPQFDLIDSFGANHYWIINASKTTDRVLWIAQEASTILAVYGLKW